GFNVKSPKFADARFREAITRSVDRQAIVSVAYGASAQAATGLVPNGVPGHEDDPCGDPCRHDVKKAKDLVAAVFGSNPVSEVAIDFDADDPAQQRIANALQA